MALNDKKVTTAEKNSMNVKSVQGSRLKGTVQENKNVFDKLVEFLIDRFNGLIDGLLGDDVAEEIKAEYGGENMSLNDIFADIVYELGNRYTTAQTDAKITEETSGLVNDVDVNLTTGMITVKYKDGTTESWDTALEKVPAKFEFTEESGAYYLKVTNEDGTSTKVNVTSLMNIYQFNNSDTVIFNKSVSGATTTLTASIKPASIGAEHLSLSLTTQIEEAASAAALSAKAAASSATAAAGSAQTAAEHETQAGTHAESAASSATAAATAKSGAETHKKTAESWAVGGTGTRTGEDANNAKYFAEQAQLAAVTATGFDYQGAWDAATAYTTGQLVSYDYTLWTAKENNINSLPYDGSANWAVFVGIPSILDMGDFGADLMSHALDPYAHGNAVVDSNESEATTQATLEEHETAIYAHGNIIIDGNEV